MLGEGEETIRMVYGGQLGGSLAPWALARSGPGFHRSMRLDVGHALTHDKQQTNNKQTL